MIRVGNQADFLVKTSICCRGQQLLQGLGSDIVFDAAGFPFMSVQTGLPVG